MPKKKYTWEQEGLVKAVSGAMESRDVAVEALKESYKVGVRMKDKRVSKLANRAIMAGVTKRDIQLIVRKMNWDDFQEFIELGADDAEA